MAFIQIVEFTSDKHDDIKQLSEKFRADTEGKRTTQRVTVTSDRDNPRRYLIIAHFESYEAAMENSNLEETDNLAADMRALVDGVPTYYNLNVLDEYEG